MKDTDIIFKTTFWDHVANSKKLIKCTLVGEILHYDKDSITFVTWDILSESEATRDNNQEVYTLIKSAIIEINPFVKAKNPKKLIEKLLKA